MPNAPNFDDGRYALGTKSRVAIGTATVVGSLPAVAADGAGVGVGVGAGDGVGVGVGVGGGGGGGGGGGAYS